MKFKAPFLIFVIAIILASCGKTPEVTQTQNAPSPSINMNANAPTVQQTLDKVGDTISSNQTFRGCIARSVQSCASEIISEYSRGDSVEVCKNFNDPALIATCTSAVTIEIARKNTDPALCANLIDPSKSLCAEQAITAKALKAWDIALCRGVALPTSSGTGNTVPFGENPRDRCRQQVIRSTPAISTAEKLCSTLESEISRTMCAQDLSLRRDMEKQMEKMRNATEPKILPPVK